jgi:hypothetical protein
VDSYACFVGFVDGVRISMPLFMRVRGEGESGKQEEEFRQDVETIVRRLLTQDAINKMGRSRLTALLETECTRTLSKNMRDPKNQDVLCVHAPLSHTHTHTHVFWRITAFDWHCSSCLLGDSSQGLGVA